MQTIATPSSQHPPLTRWRHALHHARQQVSRLRMRTTLGPLDDAAFRAATPTLRDYPYRPER